MAYIDYSNTPERLNRWLSLFHYGATSVADGGTVAHNLGTTPLCVIVTPTTSGEIVSVTAVSATTFTVAIKKISDGSAGTTQTVYWMMKSTS